jgi:predicted deacylase
MVARHIGRVGDVQPSRSGKPQPVFPGRREGTQSERIAWALTTEVVRRSDVLVDLHSGDGAEWLESSSGSTVVRSPARYDMARAAGLAFGLRNVIRYSMDTRSRLRSEREDAAGGRSVTAPGRSWKKSSRP